MRINELVWGLAAIFIIAAVCGALILLIWWLWRKIILPEGAPPPKWADLSALKSVRTYEIITGKALVVLRLVVVAGLGFLMSAPISLIHNLVRERAESYQEVVRELSRSWVDSSF